MIQMVLKKIRQLEIQPLPPMAADPDSGQVLMDVLACAICRTDAKMWDQGHRDLVFPRVLGHEMVVQDQEKKKYMVWPGLSCGNCPYCLAGKQNLCDKMEITGFHTHGGFAHKVILPKASLIPLPGDLDIRTACFAEPVGCVVNAFEKLSPKPGARILILGGGTMGLIIALYAQYLGLSPLIIEKDEAKIQNITPILDRADLICLKQTHESLFDLVINACPDFKAFAQAIAKVDKGGSICFFSGISKNQTLETNLLNLIHYKEARIFGAYGMKRSDMEKGIPFLVSQAESIQGLIQKVVPPQMAPDLLARVLAGKDLKYILDFTGHDTPFENEVSTKAQASTIKKKSDLSPLCASTIQAIVSPDQRLRAEAGAKMDDKSKPLGALGKLETLSVRICQIQNTLTPKIEQKAMLVFAGDHGITEEGVSAFPSEVTGQMVDNFLKGGAAINVLCRHHEIEMKVVDMGVKKAFEPHPDLIRAKVAAGTRNMALAPAMTKHQAVQALENGMTAFFSIWEDKGPIQIIGLGEMGIGNTTSASAIICAITGLEPSTAAGRGTGVDDEGLSHKAEVIERVLNFHHPDPENGFEILRTLGGFEIAGIAGAALAAASKGCAVVLDGVISTAAGLVAHAIHPGIQGYLIAGHKSVEKAQAAALAHMDLDPIIDLSMGLGEGTGAALAMDMVQTACKLMTEMASFDEAKISRSRSGTEKT